MTQDTLFDSQAQTRIEWQDDVMADDGPVPRLRPMTCPVCPPVQHIDIAGAVSDREPLPPGPCSAWPRVTPPPSGPRFGYQISARHPTEGTCCSYTEAHDGARALDRCTDQFPEAEGWTGHAARELGPAL